jgi:hypothetical protein
MLRDTVRVVIIYLRTGVHLPVVWEIEFVLSVNLFLCCLGNLISILISQDAKKGVLFLDFPPVLQLQLKRFEYDYMRDTMVKVWTVIPCTFFDLFVYLYYYFLLVEALSYPLYYINVIYDIRNTCCVKGTIWIFNGLHETWEWISK